MKLNGGGRPIGSGPAFDHIGIERSLRQKFDILNLASFFFEAIDKGVADAATLLLRLCHALERFEESRLARNNVQICFEVLRELADDGRLLVFSKQAVIDEDARKL